MKVTRTYKVVVNDLSRVKNFLKREGIPPKMLDELVDTCTRYLDAGEAGFPALYLQEEEFKIRGRPVYSWCIWSDLDHDPQRPVVFGPVEWSSKEFDVHIEW